MRKITTDGDVFTIKKPYYDEQGKVFQNGIFSNPVVDEHDNLIGYSGNGFAGYGFYKIATTGYNVNPELPRWR
jgi:hypothetical protein